MLEHGVDPDDIDHALLHAFVIETVGEDPVRYLVLGPDRSANLIELVVLDRPSGPTVIHAMPMRGRGRDQRCGDPSAAIGAYLPAG